MFPDASHHVPAFIIGHGNSTIEHCHDDGEPSGTAGRPVLSVLQGSGFGDIFAVVTRYFGGTKLGKGGLVRAYGDAVRTVLDGLPVSQKVATETLRFRLAYPHFENAKRLVESRGAEILDQDFGADVALTIRVLQEESPGFQSRLVDLTHGKTQVEVLEVNPDDILPVKEKTNG